MGKSKREIAYNKFIEDLKSHPELRGDVPEDSIYRKTPEEVVDLENYNLLAEHLKYLGRKVREAKGDEKELKELRKRRFETEQFMLVARFGDPNVGRFNAF